VQFVAWLRARAGVRVPPRSSLGAVLALTAFATPTSEQTASDSALRGMAALVAPKPAKPANSAPPAPAPGPTCEERIATARATPALPGAPDLEAQRAHVLLYAKAEPVVFLRTPEADAHAAKSARVYRSQFERTSYPYSILK